jgi:hypothetical protein
LHAEFREQLGIACRADEEQVPRLSICKLSGEEALTRWSVTLPV